MKKINIMFWVFNGLFGFMMIGSAIPDALSMPIAIEGFAKMGLPAYLLPFIGIAKILGVIAILIPGYPRIKEWAYAGLIFDLIGAMYCIYSSGERGGNLGFMLVPILLGAVSYIYYHKRMGNPLSSN
jgi:uncharacterized membrane protein YphA (DoxX/SURF4 family)